MDRTYFEQIGLPPTIVCVHALLDVFLQFDSGLFRLDSDDALVDGDGGTDLVDALLEH